MMRYGPFVFLLPHFLLAFCGSGAADDSEQSAAGESTFRVSLSVSPFTEMLLGSGTVFRDGELTARTPEDLQRLFMAHGANEVYARIATARTHRGGLGVRSLEKGLERAQLACKLGIPFNPELGLFGTYGDIRSQPPPDFSEYPEIEVPGPWASLKLEEMLPPLRAYGAAVARMILDTGVQVRIWDLGNEVEFGMAGVAPRPIPGVSSGPGGEPEWYEPPDAVDPEIGKMSVLELVQMPQQERVGWLQAHIWPYLPRLLAAVAQGIRSVDEGARFSTHVSGGTAVQPEGAVAFYRALADGGFLPDELGFSFYPSSSSQPPRRLKAFRETVEAVRREFGRPVFIAEYGYPAVPMHEGPFADWNHALEHYPLTPEGQADLLRDLTSWGVTAGVSGIRPWAPDTVLPGWAPMTLFETKDKTAAARPSLRAIAKGLASPDPDALKF